MTDTVEAKKPIKDRVLDDFTSLSVKQILGIVVALVISVGLYVLGYGAQCFGFFIAAVVLYMIPHLLGVTSVSVKAVVGVLFIVIAMIIGTFAYSGTISSWENPDNVDGDYVHDITYYEDPATPGNYIVEYVVSPGDLESWEVQIMFSPVESFSFGQAMAAHSNQAMENDKIVVSSADLQPLADGTGFSGNVSLNSYGHKVSIVSIGVMDKSNPDGEKLTASCTFLANLGADSGEITSMCAAGAGYTVAFAAAIFYILLVFSALMRRSLEKTRTKMEAQGRLYPQGYGRCKECGAMVLPGEVTCRKCGAYIDVPEEMRAHKKDFFECSECGAEVPSDATVCPKCGARFDSEETEVRHADGSVEVSDTMVKCPGCGAEIPSNVDFCPQCGRSMDKK